MVHRDVKPQNLLIPDVEGSRLRFIDLGGAADLRVGINYVPNEYLLDPRFAPPQQYIMSTQTPRPPPKPVAAFLSPVSRGRRRFGCCAEPVASCCLSPRCVRPCPLRVVHEQRCASALSA